MAKYSFPKELFVTKEDEGTEDEFLSAHTDASDAAVIGETRVVGHYILKSALVVETNVSVESSKS